jgi:hypothetical protein
MPRMKVKDLRPGDLVDLEGDKYADPNNNPTFQCLYAMVIDTKRESRECIAVEFDGFDVVGFPPNHTVEVCPE